MEILERNRMTRLAPLDPRRAAVLAIHWQVDVVGATGAFGAMFAPVLARSGIVPRTAALFAAARQAGARIIYVNVVYPPGHRGVICNNALFNAATEKENAFARGTPGAEVIAELAPQPQDLVVEHSRISAFYGSDLLTMLVGYGIDTVALTGVATNVAVDHSARDAVQLGFRTLIIEDCCCTADSSFHDAALVTLRLLASAVVTAREFLDLITQRT